MFTPIWGRWTHFDEHIFQMGWFNHQLEYFFSLFFRFYNQLNSITLLFFFEAWTWWWRMGLLWQIRANPDFVGHLCWGPEICCIVFGNIFGMEWMQWLRVPHLPNLDFFQEVRIESQLFISSHHKWGEINPIIIPFFQVGENKPHLYTNHIVPNFRPSTSSPNSPSSRCVD